MKRQGLSVGLGFVVVVGGMGGALVACSSSVNTGRADSGADAGVDTGTGLTDSGASDGTIANDTGNGGDSGPVGDAPTGDAGGACTAYATAQCAFLSACEPGTLQGSYGSMANCVAVYTANCELEIGPVGSGFTEALATACAAAIPNSTAKCAMGPIPRPIPGAGACTVVGVGAGGAVCGLNEQCATDSCNRTGESCGTCSSSGMAGTACGPGTNVTCALGLQCGSKDTCVPIVAVAAPCDLGVTSECVTGASCVVSDGGTTGTCQASGVKAGTPCNANSIGLPSCWSGAGFFCASSGMCEAITYGAAGATCGTGDGGTADNECAGGTCSAGTCIAPIASGQSCLVGGPGCIHGTTCTDTNGGATGVCSTVDTTCSADAGADADAAPPPPPFTFSPSNVTLQTILQYAAMAADEDVTMGYSVETDPTSPSADFTSPIEAVMQEDGSVVDLVVVNSLKVESSGGITATGSVPLVIVSLTTVSFVGGNLQANSSLMDSLSTGAGGAPESDSDVMGGGPGGGAPASGTTYVGAGGAGYCGLGGLGGGGTVASKTYGGQGIRPLVGGSAGGGGTIGGGAGGGGVQIVAAESLSIGMGSYITVGGEGGVGGGAASAQQNAGGGGSGGSILLEAPSVTIAGALAANGGGGGGAELSTASDGSDNATPAAGGAGSAGGTGAGGSGGAGTAIAGTAGATMSGANSGGGGGGVGRIRINSATGMASTAGSVISPALTTNCATQGNLRSVSSGP